MKSLQEDIERYYQLVGKPRKASFWVILVSCLSPRLLPVVFFRASGFCYENHLGLVANIFSLINLFFFGIETSPRVKVGGGLFLPHTIGTILGAERIGSNVTIMHGVTLGAREMDFHFAPLSRPIIGNNVFIGANAVVLKDVPPNSLAVGVPAKIIENSY
jgi:serine O-acetyltransferase